ncbi:MAG: DUF4906 domain-containing protein [Bacteroidales bacterium]|nr:DUF4906 domain-containing protein [Bacteroidales bacterium]
MGRERRLRDHILRMLAVSAVIGTAACSMHETEEDSVTCTICLTGGSMATRSADPDESLITDISLMVFDEHGDAEDCVWLPRGQDRHRMRLVKGKRYTICACANFGYQVYADNISELDEITFHLAYPDEYREGIPMYARTETTVTADGEIRVMLERLMSKISIRMDRSRLSEGVKMDVRSALIGNCPRAAKVFSDNKVADEDGCFPFGFYRNELQTALLNYDTGDGLSREVSLYMLENMQGRMPSHIEDDSDKILDSDGLPGRASSYIELELDYTSDLYVSGSGSLIYRFYLGEDRNSLDVRRNTHYHITVTPEDDGLSEDSWRVDRSALTYIGPTGITQYPSSYIEGEIGDRIHIWCDVVPEEAPFDVGLKYMEDDHRTGIYDYEIDPDGHGATLTLTGPGAGLIYMEAGPPVNDAALFYIIVNMPEEQ